MHIVNDSPSAKVELFRSWGTDALRDIAEGLKEDITEASCAGARIHRLDLQRELRLVEAILREREQKVLQSPCETEDLPGLE